MISKEKELRKAVDEAVKVLREGGVILYPTDTVWGLGCDATNPKAVEKIFKIKRREESKSLIMLVDGPDMLSRYIREVPDVAWQIIEINDKPLTIIYSGVERIASNAIPEERTAAFRIPEHQFCQALIRKFGRPIVSTSANISGSPSPSMFESISIEIIEAADWVADNSFEAGSTGKPSSIIMLGTGGEVKIIRE
ncbi:MAG: L-threonylcarbamoyladenylate synthase [Bacteroidales bacterium]|jgi:L-threonylcarbamoyladenylate synthase|nr:L-threonylcarbamoyladenylate synthase [Bacteroidales bacterium]MDD4057939.1 L-threonylcarbamoyladenylate synthase [Bacteroidales bacterium]